MSPERLADKKNPPADDAPIDELMEYWRFQSSGFRDLGYNILPSPRSMEPDPGRDRKGSGVDHRDS